MMHNVSTGQYSDERQVRPSPVLRSLLRPDPLRVLERLALAEHYDVERLSDTRLHMLVPGHWRDHEFAFHFDKEEERLSLIILFEGRIVSGRADEIFRLVGLLNEELSAGHFAFWAKQRAIAYRHSLTLSGGADLMVEQAMALVAEAMDAAERGHPAFQYVIWAGDTPEVALERAREDLAGEA